MPELPEVETIARRLLTVLINKKITSIDVLRSKSFVGLPEKITGAKITNISRRSKILQLHLDRPESILVHLKMTGQLIYQDPTTRLGGGHPTADWVQELPTKHTRVIMQLSEDARLFFNDMRVFGWLKVATPEEVIHEFSALAPDIIDAAITAPYFFEALQKRKLPIKLVVMDNSVIAGVGNIYTNDALNLAKIDPFRPANSLSAAEAEQLLTALKTVVQRGIDLKGATIDNFRNVDGFAGQYQTQVLVYQREGEACKNCGTTIERKKIGGRSTFFCPNCQK